MKGILTVCAILLAICSSVEARPRISNTAHVQGDWFSLDAYGPTTPTAKTTRDGGRALSTIIGGRPPGCPARFCGCGASLHLFGRIIPALNLSSNWLRFPRTSAAPNTVAVRRGHVFVLKEHVSGDTWLVHDSNSGGRKTRLHHRSIRGYVIVDPRGGNMVASLKGGDTEWKAF